VKLLPAGQILSYIEEELEKHRATLFALKKEGKTYRSRNVAYLNGKINALADVKDVIEQPQKNVDLEEAMKRFDKTE
jgi:hypothetical protein